MANLGTGSRRILFSFVTHSDILFHKFGISVFQLIYNRKMPWDRSSVFLIMSVRFIFKRKKSPGGNLMHKLKDEGPGQKF